MHWRMVPFDLQAKVYAAYRPGQSVDKNASVAWYRAALEAVKAVARREGYNAEIVADVAKHWNHIIALKEAQSLSKEKANV